MQMIGTAHFATPKLGFGTWALQGAGCARAVAEAIGLGYRLIDTAEIYDNTLAALPKNRRFVNPSWPPVWDQAA